MASTPLNFARDVKKEDWAALPQDFKKGDLVYWFKGHTYGLDRDDLMYGNRETIPCCLGPDDGTFFTVPTSMLVDKDGARPQGAYCKFKKGEPIRGE